MWILSCRRYLKTNHGVLGCSLNSGTTIVFVGTSCLAGWYYSSQGSQLSHYDFWHLFLPGSLHWTVWWKLTAREDSPSSVPVDFSISCSESIWYLQQQCIIYFNKHPRIIARACIVWSSVASILHLALVIWFNYSWLLGSLSSNHAGNRNSSSYIFVDFKAIGFYISLCCILHLG